MNRYFIPEEGRREFPRRSYAKLDQIEPPNLENAAEIVFAFDSVDAEWDGFQRGKPFSLERDCGNAEAADAYWRKRFAGIPPAKDSGFDLFDEVPLYRIELTLPRSHHWTRRLLDEADKWLEIELDEHGPLEVDVFGGLFTPPVTARISHPPRVARDAPALERIFEMAAWPDAGMDELLAALDRGCEIDRLVMFDVGQGSAAALVCVCGFPRYYFDVGCGVYWNVHTKPVSVRFCVHDDPPVILSHWDSDHWAGATLDRDLLTMTWIAPRQAIGPKHAVFANSILKAGGNVLIVPPSLPRVTWGTTQRFELRRCTGTDRNGSGLALVVEDRAYARGWLLTGDAGYDKIPPPLPSDLAAVIVPHHGADMGPASGPPRCSSHAYSRLLYSFGPGNVHGRTKVRHPTAAAVNAHIAASWPHGSWSPPPPGMAVAGQPVLATASHPVLHEHGAAIGWAAPPTFPDPTDHAANCPKSMPVTQS